MSFSEQTSVFMFYDATLTRGLAWMKRRWNSGRAWTTSTRPPGSPTALNDISDGMLAQSLLDKPFQADLTQGSVLDLPVREGRFDLVFMEEVLHHLVSRSRADSKKLAKRAIGNIKRMVRPGGAFILREEYYESWLIPTIS